MKKLISAAFVAAIAVTAMTSCCGKGTCGTSACETDTTLSKAVIDSVSMAQGNYIGCAVLSNFPAIKAQESSVTKEEILKGIQLVFGADDSRGTAIGLQFGVQMLSEMSQLQNMGIKVDRRLMLESFKKVFLQDTIDESAAEAAYGVFQNMVNSVQAEMRAKEEARIAASPEALANVSAGEKYLADAMAADSEIKTTESGLAYKIENKGDGAAVESGKRLMLKYTEKLVDGSVIHETSADGRTSYLPNLNDGFAEGLQMLAKGGKATFIVPGKLAYGVRGLPSRNVGPNATIVYDVEVLDVE